MNNSARTYSLYVTNRPLPTYCFASHRRERLLSRHSAASPRTVFGTVAAPVSRVTAGKVFFEVELLRFTTIDCCPQFGWATDGFAMGEEAVDDGVGDDCCSWGVDGARCLRWFDGDEGWGQAWEQVVLGFRKLLFGRNGEWSVLSEGICIDQPSFGGLFPALTGSSDEPLTVRANFGRPRVEARAA